MKPVLSAIPVALLLAILGTGAAGAVTRTRITLAGGVTATSVLPVRLVCDAQRCRHVGPRRNFAWYRPYGYYRPYGGDPRAALGTWHPWIGLGTGTYYDADPYD